MSELSGWSAYEKLVMSELADLKAEVATIHDEVTLVRIDLAMLKVKSGIWGAAAGFIPAAVTALVVVLTGSG